MTAWFGQDKSRASHHWPEEFPYRDIKRRRSFLQHGSMPITVDRETLARATRMASSELLHEEMAGSAEFLPARPHIRELTGAFIRAFQGYFSIEFRKLGSDVSGAYFQEVDPTKIGARYV